MNLVEYCNPFDNKKYDYFMKLEHAGRYLYARDFIKNYMNNCSVAEIGCATGYGVEFLAKYCKTIDGFDCNEKYLKIARRRKIKNASFDKINFETSILTEKQYDIVVCFETIEHIENTTNILISLSNIVKHNGILIISVPNAKYEEVDDKGQIIYKYHKHIFTKRKMLALLKEYDFDVISVLGQSLCNQIVENQLNLKTKMKNEYNEKLLNKYNYDAKSIIFNSYIFSYPNKTVIDKSYSYIYLCKKH